MTFISLKMPIILLSISREVDVHVRIICCFSCKVVEVVGDCVV